MKAALVADARRSGFDVVAVAAPDAIPEAAARLRQFVADGHHGTMHWLADTLARRSSPSALWPQVRSVVMLATNYGPAVDPRESLDAADRGVVSVYARHRDYHEVTRGKLKGVRDRFAALSGATAKVFVDTAPVMEKPLAAAAGIGWQGKHTNLVSREFGSWLFLAAIFTDAVLPPDAPATDRCGACRACLDACPTAAFPSPYRLDARRCISYLTIEHEGPIPREFRRAMGNRIYGCDDCLAVCPWNKFAVAGREAKLAARADMAAPPLAELLRLDDAVFRKRFSGSPIKRVGRNRFMRNVLIAAGNSRRSHLVADVVPLLEDGAPDVRGAAVWALGELDRARAASERVRRAGAEGHPDVRAEWSAVDEA
ncbi:MAG: tRNA epoxyqueuosine(34) reductase QueG [Bauldia sp.]